MEYIKMMGMDAESRQEQRDREIKRHMWEKGVFWSVMIAGCLSFWMVVILELGRHFR